MAGLASKENGKKGGRPKGSFAVSTLNAIEAKKKLVESFLVQQSAIDNALIEKAKLGDIPAIKELYDRVYGKSLQSMEMTGKDGKDLIPQPSEKIKELAELLKNSQ